MNNDGETKEKMAFNELKKRMKGDMENEMYEDDNLFYRFLRARDFKVDHAEYMLRQHLEWRRKIDIKNISKWDLPEVLKKYFPLNFIGYDKEGCLVKYNYFGTTDFKGLFESSSLESWLKFLVLYFEDDITNLRRQSLKIGKIVDKVVYIENLQNFSLAQATDKKVIKNIITTINMYLDNYPESLKTVYVINASVYFHMFFSVVKAFLPNTVLKKIKIYSDNSYKKDLLETIDASVLPAFLGGTRTDPDGNPQCLTFTENGQPVPKKYYLSNCKKSFPSLDDAVTMNISRSLAHEVSLDVTEPGSHIEWEFEVKSGDIKFGILYKDKQNKKTEVVPPQRIQTNEKAESGLYRCEEKGNYVVLFDNSYSYFKGKDICYKIKVKNPQEQSMNSPS